MAATLDLMQASEMRVQLKNYEAQIASGELSLFERCEIEDSILELKEQLGEFDRNNRDDSTECLHCSA
jgi:hypothetical protein